MRKAFEVENIETHEYFTMVLEPELKEVHMFDTSRTVGKKLQMAYKEVEGELVPTFCEDFVLGELQTNPLGCSTAEEYYNKLHNKSKRAHFTDVVQFLSYVDPDTIEPLEV